MVGVEPSVAAVMIVVAIVEAKKEARVGDFLEEHDV